MRSFVLRLARLHPVSGRNSLRPNSRGRRSGQALLLAVLLMIFAALIASTFITVVALNMDATATQEERQRAASAANAGANVVNYQINANGTDWRPEQASTPPVSGDPEFSYYWTAQDLAHGYHRVTAHAILGENYAPDGVTNGDWNHNGVFEPAADDWAKLDYFKIQRAGAQIEPGFVKFPDPRLEQNTGSHTYMASVALADTGDKAGMLRITVIGQSSDDPNVFVKRIGYQGTSENGGAFAWNQFLTNWNYTKNKNIAANITTSTANTLTVDDSSGFAAGRLVAIQKGNTTAVENAIISEVAGNTLKFTASLTNTYGANDSVRGASPVMNGVVGNEGITTEKTVFNADGYTPTSGPDLGKPGALAFENTGDQFRPVNYGFKSNSDIQLVQKALFSLQAQSRFDVAGTILPTPSTGNSLTHAYFAGSPSNLNIPTSFDATYPVGGPSLTGDQTKVNDNPFPNRPDDATTTSHNVKADTPPNLSKFTRLLEMTKYDGQGYQGLGSGVYINNADDLEKVKDGTNLRSIEVSELQRLLQRKSFPSKNTNGNADSPAADGSIGGTLGSSLFYRLSYPRLIVRGNAALKDAYSYPLNRALDPVSPVTMSLEQRAYRGWINDHEYVPRGAFIELNGNIITITLDDRSESAGKLPDSSKAWPYATSVAVPLAQRTDNCYRMTIDTSNNTRTFGALPAVASTEPFNGVIYAEGNVRVRGTNGAKDLTIASMGNIYVEGNLRGSSIGAGHIALLAKKNVILNPTQFVARPQGIQDSDITTQRLPLSVNITNAGDGSPGNPIQVTTASGTAQAFSVGDNIFFQGDNQPHRITAIVAPLGLEFGAALTPVPAGGTEIYMEDVAGLVAGIAGSTVTLNSTYNGAKPFRVGDPVRVGSTGHTIVQVNTAANTITLDSAPTAAVDDKVVLNSDGEIARGDKLPNGANDPNGTPEWLYRLNRGALVRNVRLDGTAPVVGNGGNFLISMRAAGTMKKAYQLALEPTPDNAAAVNTPFTVPISVHLNRDTNADGVLSPAELLLEALDTNGTTPTYSFNGAANYDLRTPANLDALMTTFNTTEQYTTATPPPTLVQKWKLSLPTGGTIPIMTEPPSIPAESQTIPARCLLAFFDTASSTSVWNARSFNDTRQLYLPTSASLYWGGTAITPAIGSPLLATDNADSKTNREDFYFYGATGSEKQQFMQWIDRAVGPTLTTDTPVVLRQNTGLGVLPPLRVSTIKLEADDFQAAANRVYTPIPISIDATIFAQEGSWFVIPMPVMHRDEIDNTAGLSTAETATATRMRRLNYAVTVTGNIVQNFAPSALYDYDDEDSPDETEFTIPDPYKGAMAQWINASSYPVNIENATGTQGRGRDWQSITYKPDTLANTKLMLPPSPDLSFVG